MRTENSDLSWLYFSQVLEELFDRMGVVNTPASDFKYYKYSLARTEKVWTESFKKMKNIRFVLLGEAPLFGEKESYFYNPASGATSFFTYKDAEVICGEIVGRNRLIKGVRERKLNLITKLIDAGFLVLDVYPFCFTPPLTSISYRQIEKQNQLLWLFQKTYSTWLEPKLRMIHSISPSARFGFRYKNTHDNIGQAFDAELLQIGFVNNKTEPYHLGRNLNRNKIQQIF